MAAKFKLGDDVRIISGGIASGLVGVVRALYPGKGVFAYDVELSQLHAILCFLEDELAAAVNSLTGPSLLSNPQYAIAQSIYKDEIYHELLPQAAVSSLTVCECGGEKTYGKEANLHSDWCPAYGNR